MQLPTRRCPRRRVVGNKAVFRRFPGEPKKGASGSPFRDIRTGATETTLPDASWNQHGSGHAKAAPCDTPPVARAPWAKATRAPGRSRTLAKRLEAKLARCSVVGSEARSPRHGRAERGLRGTDRTPSAPRLIQTRRPRTYELGHAAEPNHRTKPLTFERKAGEPWNRPAPLQGEPASVAAERASWGRIHDARSDLPRASGRVGRRRSRTNTCRRKPPDRQILKTPNWAFAISAPSRSILIVNKKAASVQYQNRL
jgi:hypothetical protein